VRIADEGSAAILLRGDHWCWAKSRVEVGLATVRFRAKDQVAMGRTARGGYWRCAKCSYAFRVWVALALDVWVGGCC
jgi:hypothetical protein